MRTFLTVHPPQEANVRFPPIADISSFGDCLHMSEVVEDRLSLRPATFYGWTMYPGYLDRPYRSPILIEQVDTRHDGVFELLFLNIFYSAGVQQKAYLLRPLRWEKSYLVAEQMQGRNTTDRTIIIEHLDKRWIEENSPTLPVNLRVLFDDAGQPVEREFRRLAASVY